MHKSYYTVDIKVDNDRYILLSTKTGLIDIVGGEVINLLNTEDVTKSEEVEIVRYLEERGYVTELSKEKEIDSFCKELERRETITNNRISIIIIPTYECNLRCYYCFERSLWRKENTWLNKILDKEKVDKIFEVVERLKDEGKQVWNTIILFGGEPLLPLSEDILRYILDQGNKKGFSFEVITNGVYLLDYVDVLKSKNVNIVQVTIDGPKMVHDRRRVGKKREGTFDKIVKGIDAAKEHIKVRLRMNIDSANVDYLDEFVEFIKFKSWIKNKNIKICISPVRGYSNESYLLSVNEFFNKIQPKLIRYADIDIKLVTSESLLGIEKALVNKAEILRRTKFCGACGRLYIFDPHGDIYTCVNPVGDSRWKIGSYYPRFEINQDTFKKWFNRTGLKMRKCRNCKYMPLCSGGCAYLAYQRKGDLYAPLCSPFKQWLKPFIKYLYELKVRSP